MDLKKTVTALAAAIGLVSGTAAIGDDMSRLQYEAARKAIESDYKSARTGCEPMPDNAKDACEADIKGRQVVALAELEVEYRPSDKSRSALRVARANAAYASAREKCHDRTGAAKETCVADAKARYAP